MDAVVAAELVVINDEACVLCAVQDARAERTELIAAIGTVVADAPPSSLGVIETLVHLHNPQLGNPRAAEQDGGRSRSRRQGGV